MADRKTRALGTTLKEAAARPPKDSMPWDQKLLVRRELGRDLVSLSNLLGRPVRSSAGARVGRVIDVVAHWETGTSHPLISGALVRVGKVIAMVPIDQLTLTQTVVRISSPSLLVEAPAQGDGYVQLARDVLDHQLVDVSGVQVVRRGRRLPPQPGPWLGAGRRRHRGPGRCSRRLLPKRRHCPPPDRVLDWADLQAFVPREPGRPRHRAPRGNGKCGWHQ